MILRLLWCTVTICGRHRSHGAVGESAGYHWIILRGGKTTWVLRHHIPIIHWILTVVTYRSSRTRARRFDHRRIGEERGIYRLLVKSFCLFCVGTEREWGITIAPLLLGRTIGSGQILMRQIVNLGVMRGKRLMEDWQHWYTGTKTRSSIHVHTVGRDV